ncbi:hypothetical protein Pmani_006787 [Petrolisthes manimaculis]|uniref:Uncharacterized protein n=1 Tax=Petrolisthes manimaculis TaxID=1843537 RepID=A0AAE1QBV4_9EUCA|nr:hypothetical protein Pmani_006787 [Petrolisthes manimaculis]
MLHQHQHTNIPGQPTHHPVYTHCTFYSPENRFSPYTAPAAVHWPSPRARLDGHNGHPTNPRQTLHHVLGEGKTGTQRSLTTYTTIHPPIHSHTGVAVAGTHCAAHAPHTQPTPHSPHRPPLLPTTQPLPFTHIHPQQPTPSHHTSHNQSIPPLIPQPLSPTTTTILPSHSHLTLTLSYLTPPRLTMPPFNHPYLSPTYPDNNTPPTCSPPPFSPA